MYKLLDCEINQVAGGCDCVCDSVSAVSTNSDPKSPPKRERITCYYGYAKERDQLYPTDSDERCPAQFDFSNPRDAIIIPEPPAGKLVYMWPPS